MQRMIPTHEPELVTIKAEPLSLDSRFRSNAKRLRFEQNLSYAAIAERLTEIGHPCSDESVRALLNGKSCPVMKWIELLSRVFDCTEYELLQECDVNP